jgi:hypothetical protein
MAKCMQCGGKMQDGGATYKKTNAFGKSKAISEKKFTKKGAKYFSKPTNSVTKVSTSEGVVTTVKPKTNSKRSVTMTEVPKTFSAQKGGIKKMQLGGDSVSRSASRVSRNVDRTVEAAKNRQDRKAKTCPEGYMLNRKGDCEPKQGSRTVRNLKTGGVNKMQSGGQKYPPGQGPGPFATKSAKAAAGILGGLFSGIGGGIIADVIKKRKENKAEIEAEKAARKNARAEKKTAKKAGTTRTMSKMQSGGMIGMPKYGNNPRTPDGNMLKKGGVASKINRAVSAGCRNGMVKDANGRCVMERKMAKGGAAKFGMLSVKARIDKNPRPTAADRIAGAKKNKRK